MFSSLRLAHSDDADFEKGILGRLLDRAIMQDDTPSTNSPTELMVPGEAAAAGQAEARFDEQNAIIRILRDTNGRVGGPNGAAARMGLKRTTLITRMKKLGTVIDLRARSPKYVRNYDGVLMRVIPLLLRYLRGGGVAPFNSIRSLRRGFPNPCQQA